MQIIMFYLQRNALMKGYDHPFFIDPKSMATRWDKTYL